MTSDPSLQESCMAALRHMGVEVVALVGKANELEAENEKLIVKLNAEHIVRQNVEIENAKLRELLSMYVTFARTVAPGLCIQSAYADGMGRELDEADMRERAMELGIGGADDD